MLRTVARRAIGSRSSTATAPISIRHNSTQGSVEAKVTSPAQHPTHKDKDEKVLAKAREVAKDVASGKQSPNREMTWSAQQQPRQLGMRGPRFEQTDLDMQVCFYLPLISLVSYRTERLTVRTQPQPQAAIELIAQVPVRMETRRIVSCDGGGGALGHPKVYINLDKAGEPNVCPYCERLPTS